MSGDVNHGGLVIRWLVKYHISQRYDVLDFVWFFVYHHEILDITGYWMILASEKAINLIAISGSNEPLTR